MNVLLITFSFPPAGGVGVLRALSLAKYLPENGVRVDVLTARNAPAVVRDEGLLRQVPTSVTVHRTWTLDLPFALRKGIRKLLSREKSGTLAPAAATNAAPAKANPLKTFIANLLLPDPQIGWLPFASRAAARIVRTRQIDAVLITVPPFSSLMLAKQLRKQFPKLTIVLDFRDEWLNTTLQLVSLNSNPKARLVADRTEREAVIAATAVVAVTEAARDVIRSRYPDQPAEKFVSISNGYDGAPPTSVSPQIKAKTVTLTYLGSVYGSTEPSSFVEAVLGLAPELRARLRIRFVGHCEKAAYRDTLLRMGDTVTVSGFLPQAEALALLDATDYVLLLSHDPVNVSAKFYDYLRSAKPILAAVHPDGDVRRRLEETRGGRWADIADVDAIRRMLVDAIEQPTGQTFQPDLDAVARYHRKPLAAQYASLLHSLSPATETAR
ncbi:MAG: glycosyltransferase [Janthinobacterium lividum]